MGDVPPHSGASNDFSRDDGALGGSHESSSTSQPPYPPGQMATAYQSTFQHFPHQHYGNPQQLYSSQLDMPQPQGQGRGGPYNMNTMLNALPQSNYRPAHYAQNQQRYNAPVDSTQGVSGQISAQHYGGQATLSHIANQQYYVPQHAHMAQYYPTPLSPSQVQTNLASRQNLAYYSNHVMVNQPTHSQAAYYYPQAGQFQNQGASLPTQLLSPQYLPVSSSQSDLRLSPSHAASTHPGAPMFSQEVPSETRQNVVRGPPRKPRQSGHAIWIGNLPPQTDLMSLVHHVCKEASDLESLFLISKSNCAFANFKDEPSCVAAQQKLHDSKFQSVRLVSRLRKSTVEGATGVTAPTGPSSSTSQPAGTQEDAATAIAQASEEEQGDSTPTVTEAVKTGTTGEGTAPPKDKFFILKSLTVEDLELSVRTGIWATQSHNEETLNKAFESVENVYLIFSANKSGEYFGFGRMTSRINEDPAAAIEFAPKAQASNDLDLPKAIPTEATEYAPRGRIIDDSARGTIFWEAERDETSSSEHSGEEAGSTTSSATDSVQSGTGDGAGGENKAWGKPFKLEWISTTRLPFYRTRGLRNPWNSNREVKIARDGTELEPSVGRRLIGLFNRVQSPAPPGGMAGTGAAVGLRGTMPMVAGYPPMRLYHQ